jgi:Ca2+-binding RTX toxin-like protein
VGGDIAADSILGGSGDDTIQAFTTTAEAATAGDLLDGGDGNDTLTGGDAADTISGGDGNDIINGNAGDDVIAGGNGDDQLTGGADADLFAFAGNESGSDTIADFEDGVDLLLISGATNVNVEDTANGALISFGDATVLLSGVAAADLSAADFLFA